MSKENIISTIMTFVIAIILIAIGAVGLSIIIPDEIEDNEFFNNAETCTATVKGVHTYTTRSRTKTGSSLRSKSRTTYTTTTHHDAYVSYTINGVNYDNVTIPHVSPSLKKGDTLTLYYDPQKPDYVCIKSDSTHSVISLCILSALVIGGIVIIVMEIISVKRKFKKQPQLSAQSVFTDSDGINDTSATYNGYNDDSQNYMDNQNIYDPNQTYTGYEENSFDTYNGYSQNDNSNSFNSQQLSPFNTYGNNSQSDSSNSFNSQQSSPFNTYGNNSQTDSSKPKSPFDRYKN
ncbi:MAG: DUF3592 domain-containing protein [Clostridia bacterium]|nr:DUF3592 domain-containing protein [Clostridia bacterium]